MMRLIIILILSFAVVNAFADEIPIEDLSQPAGQIAQQQQAPDIANGAPVEQRLAKLEQQMQNLTQMNMPQQLEAMRQQLQQLNGQLDEQAHEIQVLKQQLKSFYQDLDQRLNNVKAGGTTQTSATSDVLNSPEDQAYKAAFGMLSNKKYNKSAKLMQKYLQDYADGKYAANAHYWLGEIYYLQGDLAKAAAELEIVITKFADSPKVPDSMLKMAMIYRDQGKYNQARDELKQIKKKFSDSAAARLVDQQLQQLSTMENNTQ
jgi:tol-pal system protein YbgF